MGIYNLVSLLGLLVLMFLAWSFSNDKKNMNWKVIGWAVAMQMIWAVFIFAFPAGTKLFLFLNGVIIRVMDSAAAGARFVFGRLAIPVGGAGENGEPSLGFILAFQAFPTIIFFSAVISILYFYNIMQWLIRGFAYLFTRFMRISGAESLATASNIFLGIESNLTIRPHLDNMTRSELCTVLTAGMATVSSNIMALYIFSLKDQFPTIAGHLMSASILSAPAALVMSKILCPEKDHPKTLGLHIQPHYEKDNNLFEAIINGANAGVRMIVGITALLIAVIGLLGLFDLALGWLGSRMNSFFHISFVWTLQNILGYVFYPLTVIIGVPLQDAAVAARLIGERVVVTEVVAYQDLAVALSRNMLHDPRSAVITVYALCGFAHLASMAIFVGALSALAPKRTRDISGVAFRALAAATLACLMTACVAGAFFSAKGTILLGK